MTSLALALPAVDLSALEFRIRRLADKRPGTYRMLDQAGRILYVGKAKCLRTRLMSYFRCKYPDDKGARILHASSDIRFDYAPSEFAACLAELRLIRKHRPPYNVAMNKQRGWVFLVLTDERAARLVATQSPERYTGQVYGPLPSRGRVSNGARVLSDMLALRDCRGDVPMHFAEQGDLFSAPRRAACPRFDFGTCLAPCAGEVSEITYRSQATIAAAFCEGRTIRPIDRIVDEMTSRSAAGDFEAAVRWREKFEALEWLLSATTRARAALELLTFVYRDPGSSGDDRIYLIRRGEVRGGWPDPVTPLEREAFAAQVRDELAKPAVPAARVEADHLHERLLVMHWFRTRPDAWRRTTALDQWIMATS